MKIREIVLLEALRKTKSEVILPIAGNWAPIKNELKTLFKEGYLEIKNNSFVISEDGKKVILLFNDKRAELIEPFNDYKVLTIDSNPIDARLPMAAFKIRNQIPEDVALDYLENLNVFLIWEDFFRYVKSLSKDGSNWQGLLFKSFELQAKYEVTIDAWKKLGKDSNSAIIKASKMLLPEFAEIYN